MKANCWIDKRKVRVEEVKRAPIESWVRAPGRVQPERTVQISSNVQGRVELLAIAEGDRLSRGDLLLELDDERYRTQAAQSRARLDAAVANLQLAWALGNRAREPALEPDRRCSLFRLELSDRERIPMGSSIDKSSGPRSLGRCRRGASADPLFRNLGA